jgi:hypothetical protein
MDLWDKMCYIDDDSLAPGTYITYKTLPLRIVQA